MQLIGMLDSPYVRRVAITLKRLAIPFEHKSLSVFRDFDTFSQINPIVKAPTLVTDDGVVLVDSTLILQYIEGISAQSLMPETAKPEALRLIGLALMACDKTVQIVYERTLRPAEKQYQPWLERVAKQLHAAYGQLEQMAHTFTCDSLLQPEITIAVAWRFTQLYTADVITLAEYPQLAAFSAQAETLPEFLSTPVE
ncbi:glutathione s-transferase [Leptolyngbya sp. Heron Island J]|uniref:glutathione S-transferase n=1 Tax=Leptolyngbya sp. Heron Island J TaxID=1385935 RepID=UPI0003B9C97E|nr:glutathione S-transferase [Leptolyngbya sp. Heron Island J]ESA35903.1 glutathione s-transferase [Leptolyngbya sp. Heron Island J]